MIKKITRLNKYVEQDYPYFYQYHKLSQDLLIPKDVIVRIYILEVHGIKAKDLLSPSDPYFKLYFGDTIIDDQKSFVNDVEDYGLFKMFQLSGKLPGASTLRIELMDYDPLFSDELIGYTEIDIEDRFFDKNWRNLKYKPIETRKFLHDDIKGVQASMTMWLEIFVENDRTKIPIWDISPPPKKEMELRLIVWETRDIPNLDVEETSDIYVSAFVDDKHKRESTDVHYRCQTGCGSFNWRVLLPVFCPSDYSKLKIQVFDNDFFSKDDFICGHDLDLGRLFKEVFHLDIPITFTKTYFEEIMKNLPKNEDIKFEDPKNKKKFWLQMYQHNDVFIIIVY